MPASALPLFSIPLRFVPNVAYTHIDTTPLLLDIFAPLADVSIPHPVIVWIHGGGWAWGTRRDYLDISSCARFAAAGFFTVSIEYRLSSVAHFPAQIQDVQAVLQWIQQQTKHYHLDPNAVGLCGHSAGGHLAALAGVLNNQAALKATTEPSMPPIQVQAVAIGSAPTNFLHTGGWMVNDADSPVTQLFGGTVHQQEALMRLASPVTHVHANVPPFLIAHGTRDEVVPFEQAEEFAARLIEVGGEVEFIPLVDRYHNWTMREEDGTHPGGEEGLSVMALPFFQKHLLPTTER